MFDIEAVFNNTTSVTTTWENTGSTAPGYVSTEVTKADWKGTTSAEDQTGDGITGLSPTTSYTSFVTSETVTSPMAVGDTTGKMSSQEWS